MKPQIDFIFSGKTFDKAIIERVLEWRIFIKQQQDILLPIYHKVSFPGVESMIPRSFKSIKALKTVSLDTL